MANKTMAVASLSVCMLCLLMQITLHLNSIYQDHGMVEQHQMRCHGFKLLRTLGSDWLSWKFWILIPG
jgi:hypothetical protein